MKDMGASNEFLLEILRHLGVSSVDFSFSGSGDSGDMELDYIEWLPQHADGSPVVKAKLSDIPFSAHYSNQNIRSSCSVLEAVIRMADESLEAEHGGWENNEGAYGNVWIRPFEADPISLECTDYEPDEDQDFGDDFGEEPEEDFEEDENPLPAPNPARATSHRRESTRHTRSLPSSDLYHPCARCRRR